MCNTLSFLFIECGMATVYAAGSINKINGRREKTNEHMPAPAQAESYSNVYINLCTYYVYRINPLANLCFVQVRSHPLCPL